VSSQNCDDEGARGGVFFFFLAATIFFFVRVVTAKPRMRRTRFRDGDSSKNKDDSEATDTASTSRSTKRSAAKAAAQAENVKLDEEASRDRAFQDKLRDVLRQIPPEYKDKSFSHIAVVARSLKKQRPQDDLQELNKAYDELSTAVSDIVDGMFIRL
jgi:hypothetical protein